MSDHDGWCFQKKKSSVQPSASDKELQRIYDAVSGQAVDSIDACDLQQMLTSVGQAGQLGQCRQNSAIEINWSFF